MEIAEELQLSSVKTFSRPFPYLHSPQAFTKDVSQEILNWLEFEAPWKLIETNFYEQYEFSVANAAELPARLSFLRKDFFLTELKARIGHLFRATLGSRIDLTAHKLVPGQRIRIHNDFIPGQETHRLLIQLNRDWTDKDGGFLLLVNSADPTDVHRIFRPIHNSVIGLAVTPNSHHAVSAVKAGGRFTLVYSFYGDDGLH